MASGGAWNSFPKAAAKFEVFKKNFDNNAAKPLEPLGCDVGAIHPVRSDMKNGELAGRLGPPHDECRSHHALVNFRSIVLSFYQ